MAVPKAEYGDFLLQLFSASEVFSIIILKHDHLKKVICIEVMYCKNVLRKFYCYYFNYFCPTSVMKCYH